MVPRLTSGGSTAAGLAPRPLTDALGVWALGLASTHYLSVMPGTLIIGTSSG